MIDLPLEIIDHIFNFVDATSLYRLGQVSHVLRSLSQNHLYKQHIQHISLRLWMHQPGTMAHIPIDFCKPTQSGVFKYVKQPLRFDPKKPVLIDGCTVILSNKHHYGLTYPSPILFQPGGGDYSEDIIQKDGQWALVISEQQQQQQQQLDGYFKPIRLSCDLNLFNPIYLESLLRRQTMQLQERIRRNKEKLSMSFVGLKTPFAVSKPLDSHHTPLLSS